MRDTPRNSGRGKPGLPGGHAGRETALALVGGFAVVTVTQTADAVAEAPQSPSEGWRAAQGIPPHEI